MIDEVTFLRKIQRILEEGDFVATYKFALLHCLADLSVEIDPAADGTLRLSLEHLAERFIDYYWRQAIPYRDGAVLLQNSGKQAAVINRVSEAHSNYQLSLPSARRDADGWRKLRKKVEDIILDMPLWRLQLVGDQKDEFLYKRETANPGDILLEPGIARSFRIFHSFIVTMVRGAWVEQILKIRSNRELLGEQADLTAFLFGSDRQPLQDFRRILRSHQQSRCFYCDERVKGEGVLDHFIPWARYPMDLGHNFVYSDGHCNSAKRDHLAAIYHLRRWKEQNLDHAADLDAHFEPENLRYDARRSMTIAAWAYEHAELSESRVWLREKTFEGLDPAWRELLST